MSAAINPGKNNGMGGILGILGLVLTLATIIVAPAPGAFAAASAPAMQMEDGAPCPKHSCARMPDCPMALPCLSVAVAIAATESGAVFLPAVQNLRFALATPATLPSLEGRVLRRPPRI